LLLWRLHRKLEAGLREGARGFLLLVLVLAAAASRSFEGTGGG
jgi:hypothetical protein